jgi:CDP-6-deoxy-D-xylo-4-hexulose-3-dehydrase
MTTVSGTGVETDSTTRRREIRNQVATLVEEYFALATPRPPTDCPLSVPLYDHHEVVAALDCLLSQEVTMGARVRAFEQRFASFIGSKHAIMVNSGSSANLLALAALSSPRLNHPLRPGDEVIVPAVTWPTTVTPVLQHGCVPVLVDVDPATLNLRPETLAEALSERTRAIMPVHLLGNPVNMDRLMDFAHEHDLWVVEDTCESLGTSIGERKAGAIGHFGTFSFYFSHHITTVEGGMLVTDDDQLADLGRSIRAHGWTRDLSNRAEIERVNREIDPRFLFVNIGYNLRPMEIQGAFGDVQLNRLDEFNHSRRTNARYLLDQLGDLSDHLEFVTEQEGGRSTWFGFTVLCRSPAVRNALMEHLEEDGIATRPIVAGNLALQPAFRDNPHRQIGDLANANRIGSCGLFIGNHPDLSHEHLEHIVKSFRGFFEA